VGVVSRSRRIDFEGLHVPAAGPTILPSSTSKIGVPLWASGYRVPQIPASQQLQQWVYMRVLNANNAFVLGDTTFFVAG
jgi:hypothetical protein